MPWGRIDDRLAMSAKIRGLTDPGARGERAKRQRAESLGVWTQVLSWVSGERSDGFVTADIMDLFGWPAANERLMRARFGRAPLLHSREDGDDCECLKGRAWPADYDYLIHDFLTRNPSRAENDREKAKRADRRDARLKQLVYDRDGGCCRYCRSGPLSPKAGRSKDRRRALEFDHVDPDQAAGPDGEGYVTACARCNRNKEDRTPDEADMLLLPEPTPAQRDAWQQRGQQLFDRPQTLADDPAAAPGSATESATDQQQNTDPITDRITDPAADPHTDPIDNTTGEVRPDQGEQPPRSATSAQPRGTGPGRVGPRPDGDPEPDRPPPQPARSGTAPDIYHRRSRASPPALPEYVWPPGSVPARPPTSSQEQHHDPASAVAPVPDVPAPGAGRAVPQASSSQGSARAAP